MWMSRNPLTVELGLPVVEAAKLMAQRKVRRLLVAEKNAEGQHLLGIVSAQDVIHAFPPSVNPFAIASPDARATTTIVSQIMTPRPRTVVPETPIENAAAMMCDHKIGALPVLRANLLVGLITESDVFRAFASLFSATEPGARITFDAALGEDIFAIAGPMAKRHQLQIASLVWTKHDELPVCVLRVVGQNVDDLLDELWSSGHPVMNVIRFTESAKKNDVASTSFTLRPARNARADSALYS